jgi:hypothetical protein
MKFLILILITAFLSGCMASAKYKSMTPEQRVAEVQTQLKTLGYYNGPTAGYFDEQTAAAIRNFQRDKNILPQDGQVSEKVYLQAGSAIFQNSKFGKVTEANHSQTLDSSSSSHNVRSAQKPATGAGPDPCATADWTGTVNNIADLFSCDEPRAIETLSGGRRIMFEVGNVEFHDSKLMSSMSEVPSYVKAAQKANVKGQFSWNNWFDVTGSKRYRVICIFENTKATALKKDTTIEITAKLVRYSSDIVVLSCS